MKSILPSVCLFALLAAPMEVYAQDPPEPGPWLFGATRLSRPDPAVDEDASGSAVMHQFGDRKAIHVHVRNLAPGATYEVSATLGDDTESLGNITTRGEATDRPARLFAARLSGAQEVPPVETRARGFGSFLLDREGTKLTYHVVAWGLSGPLTAAHIHQAPVGEDGPVLIPIDEKTLTGTVDVTAEQVEALRSGDTYVNLHTEANPDGEIRGQLKPIIFRPFPFFRRAGSGALKIDTKLGDELPFDATSIEALAGITISILDGDDKVVLSGTIAEIRSFGRHDDDDGDDGARDGGGALFDPAPPTDSEPTFVMDDEHDASFVRGDTNEDGAFDISDPVSTLLHLFQGLAAPYCRDAADADDDGTVDITDPVVMLDYLFRAGDALPHPFGSRGFDETADTLFCEE